MGTEGDRRRNRARRIREKEQKRIKKKWDIPLIWIIGIAFFSWFSYEIYKGEKRNLLLYKTGVETTAFIYDLSPGRHGYYRHYEFYVNGRRYKGTTMSGKLGYTIPIFYLPADPNVNETKVRDCSLIISFYNWFNKDHDSD